MSLMMRIAALVLFLAVLVGEPTPVRAWDCPYECTTVVQYPPYYVIDCDAMMCIDIPSCQTNCIVLGCEDYEWGASLALQC